MLLTNTYTANEDISIDGNEKLLPGSDVFDYRVSADGTIIASIYNPTYKPRFTITNGSDEGNVSGMIAMRFENNITMVKDNVLMVPRIQLDRNKTITTEFTVLKIARPREFFGIPLDKSFFPLDQYVYILDTPLREYSLNYSSEIVFPTSFQQKEIIMNHPYIQHFKVYNSSITILAADVRDVISTTTSTETDRLRIYTPLMVIPSSAEFEHINNIMNKSYTKDEINNNLNVTLIYGRPWMYIIIFVLSVLFMLLVIKFHPIDNKDEALKFCYYMGSIWIAQEGVIFLQGHRPLEFTLYDTTIFLVLIPLILFIIRSRVHEYKNKIRHSLTNFSTYFETKFKFLNLEKKEHKLQLIELLVLIGTLYSAVHLESDWIWLYIMFTLASVIYFIIIQKTYSNYSNKEQLKAISWASLFVAIFFSALLSGNLFISLPKVVLPSSISLLYTIFFFILFAIYYIGFLMILWVALKKYDYQDY